MYQGAAIFWADVSHRHSLWLPIGKTSGITKSQYTNLILMDSYSTPYRDSVSSVILWHRCIRGLLIFWVEISRRHSLWLPMGKTSAITKSLCINLIVINSYSTPHRDSVSSVIFGIDVSGGCYILGGSLSETFTMATYRKN